MSMAKHAHEVEPSWRTCVGVANIYRDMGRVDEAVAQYYKSLEYDPEDTSAFLDAGDTLVDAERYQEAIDAYEHYFNLRDTRPDSPHWAAQWDSMRVEYGELTGVESR